MTKREHAIAIIEKCRDIHLLWARWQRKKGRNWPRLVERRAVGGPTFHRTWARNYDVVLRVLRDDARR